MPQPSKKTKIRLPKRYPNKNLKHKVKQTLLRVAEKEHSIWTYGSLGTSGVFRLISVAELLKADNARIHLIEWYDLKFSRDGLGQSLERDPPPNMPRYCAVSHVWEASKDTAQRSKEANRPLEIDLGDGRSNTISWHGLVQSAIAAESLDCEYLWLDLLCLDQTSRDDKKLQIQNMSRIYSNATSVAVMVGGIHAAQSLGMPSTWIHRAWTFQEATLCFRSMVVAHWDYPGSFSINNSLSIKKLRGKIALVSLNELLELAPGKKIEAGTLITPQKDIEYELDLAFNCLGSDKTAMVALKSSLRTVPIEFASSQSSVLSISDYSLDHDSDDMTDIESWEDVPEDESENDAPGSTDEHELQDNTRISTDEDISDGEADDWIEEEEEEGDSNGLEPEGENSDTRSLSDDETSSSLIDSDLSNVSLSDSVEKWTYYDPRGDGSGVVPTEILYEAAWRNMWLRTSTKPQDMVFSVMHYLGVSIKVDYKRDLEELIFELVAKSPMPGWMTIGYDIPVYPKSGLVPILPEFAANSVPTYSIKGETRLASEFVYSEYYCVKFDAVITSSGKFDDGHLVCARLFEIQDPKPPYRDEKDPSFNHSELRLSSPTFEFHADCKFKGTLGSVLMIVGTTQTVEDESFGDWSGTPFVYLLDKNGIGIWGKTGAGFLDEPVFKRGHFLLNAARRHLHAGGDTGHEISECHCEIPLEEKKLLKQIRKLEEENDDAEAESLDTALFDAASKGDEKLILKLLDSGADINANRIHKLQHKRGTPLHAACLDGKSRIVRLLIGKGANINAIARGHGTPLQTACYCGWESVARVLLEKGAIVNAAASSKNGTTLQCAMKSIGLVKLLLEFGADPNATGGEFGTCLMAATQSRTEDAEEIIQLLLDKGADINSTDGNLFDGINEGGTFNTALQIACNAGELPLVRFLCARGADPNVHGNAEHTVLQVAAKSGSTLIMKELIAHGADIHANYGEFGTALLAAARANHGYGREPALILLDHGADINCRGGKYNNVLQAAVSMDMPDIELFKFLVAKGASLHAKGGYYGTVLQAAVSSDEPSKEIIEFLLSAKVDVNAKGGYYGTVLQAAVMSIGKIGEVVKMLIQASADVNGGGGYYCNALQAASYMGQEDIVKLLIEKGADVNAQGGYYGNALQGALADNDNKVIVNLLIEKGAAINAQGGHFANSLQVASWMGNEAILKLLIENGVDINIQGGHFGNALQASLAGGFESIAKLLIEKGADVNAKGGYYGNALQAALFDDNEAMVKLLIDKGADVNIQGGAHKSALQAALYYGHNKISKILIDAGADILVEKKYQKALNKVLNSV